MLMVMPMLEQYEAVLIFFILSIGMIAAALFAGKRIHPDKMTDDKISTYECGERPIGNARANFNIRFYIVSLIFILFDVEVVFILPVATVYKEYLSGPLAFTVMIELVLFITILIFALIYVWSKGDLNWIKTVNRYEKID
jgi:NADH-quinone oxidoreductase subunit A